MKKIIAISILLLPVMLCAQDRVNWTNTVKKVNINTYEIHLKASVQSPWHIYSQKTPAGGPAPTKIRFTKNPMASLISDVKEKGILVKKHEEVFDIDVLYYENEVDFIQTVKLKGNVKTNIKGSLTYMVCNDKQCLLPTEVRFDLPLQ